MYKGKDFEKTEYNTDMNTDDILSDDFDFYSRKRNFEIVSKKLNNYFDTKFAMYRGNDYKYNNYLRKLEKLSKNESLDHEGFKEYLDCIKNLNESNNKVLENIGQHFLTELMGKENLHKEIEELIKIAKNSENFENFEKNQKFFENSQKNEKSEKNSSNENFNKNNLNFDYFLKSCKNDTTNIIEILSNNFKSAAKEVFKVSEEENFTDKEFQDIKNLRIAKMLIKIRHMILTQEAEAEDNEKIDEFGNKKLFPGKFKSNLKSKNSENPSETSNSNFFSSIFENLKSSSSNSEDIPLFDKNMYESILNRHSNVENYDDMLFKNINNHLLSTKTFTKYKDLLFHPEFYGNENLSSEDKLKLLQNPNIYLLSNELIDEMINSLLHKIKQKYEVNEIYRDEETDLNTFEKDEATRLKRRNEMNEKLLNLKSKYGDIDLLYYTPLPGKELNSSDKNMMKEIFKFRQEYEKELSEKYDMKFKKDFRIVKPEMKLRKYYTQEEIDEEKVNEEKEDKIRERIEEEIRLIKLGKKGFEEKENSQISAKSEKSEKSENS
jgi:hypothetical protein